MWSEVVYNPGGLMLGGEVGFLGFPFGLESGPLPQTAGWPTPFLKKGYLSGHASTRSGNTLFYLDGHNNPGFSGGPAFFVNSSTGKTHVFGVVSGFMREKAASGNDGYVESGTTWVNAGIVECHPLARSNKASGRQYRGKYGD
jgi:hypothetical protein